MRSQRQANGMSPNPHTVRKHGDSGAWHTLAVRLGRTLDCPHVLRKSNLRVSALKFQLRSYFWLIFTHLSDGVNQLTRVAYAI